MLPRTAWDYVEGAATALKGDGHTAEAAAVQALVDNARQRAAHVEGPLVPPGTMD